MSEEGNKKFGQDGEDLALKFLKQKGFKWILSNFESRWGEIDLVMQVGQTLVFVEVKTRQSHDAGHPAEAVTPDKQQRLTRLALGYLKRHGLLEHSARFDVVAVTWPNGQRRPILKHVKNAFEATGREGMYS